MKKQTEKLKINNMVPFCYIAEIEFMIFKRENIKNIMNPDKFQQNYIQKFQF